MKKRMFTTVLVALSLLLSIAAPALAEDVIKIGGIGVLSGDYALYGLAVKEGVDLYVKQINESGGVLGKKVEVIWEDTQGEAANAINAYYKVLEQDGAVALLGAVLSGETKALAEVSAEDGIPQITPSATAYDVTTDRPNVFRTCFLDPFQGNAIAQYMSNEGFKKVAVLYDNATEYSAGLFESFSAKSKELGVEIISASAAYGDKDYKTQLTTLKNANPDAVFLPYYGADAAMILAQAKEIGLNVKFYGADGIADIVDYVADKSLLTQVVYTDHFTADADSEMAVNFVKSFQAEYGKMPTISFSATGYDAALVLINAIQQAGTTDSEAVIAALKATNVVGVSGKISFDNHNDPIKSAFLLTFNADGAKQYLTQVDP